MPDISDEKVFLRTREGTSVANVVLGELVGFDPGGTALVDWPDNPSSGPCPAISTTTFSIDDVGRSVALLFADGDARRPLIVGMVRQPLDSIFDATEVSLRKRSAGEADHSGSKGLLVERDQERVTLSADREVVIRCGKASITLTRSGKVLIRGEYVLSRSGGANKLMGGSVHIN